jgi:hypothetical protein
VSWQDEFGAGYGVPSVLTNHPRLEDTSWHNDVCPSFTTPALYSSEGDTRLWVEHEDEAMREYETPRYRVCTSEGDILFEHETDVEGALAALFAVPVPVDPRVVALLGELSRVLALYNTGQAHSAEALHAVKGAMHRFDTDGIYLATEGGGL